MYQKSILLIICISIMASCNNTNKLRTEDSNHAHTNHLIHESSPYLLQHAHNPVDWYPWGEEALEKAKKENKLLIISIGYSACHWCHVMEHESFEDSLVAKIMNDNFVAIKVDREERPDIDDVYMTACHLVSGRGGWPLNAFALPDGRPIWAATYFPKDEWIKVLNQFIDMQKNDPSKLEESAAQITAGLKLGEAMNVVSGDKDFNKNELMQIGDAFMQNIDFDKGGRKGSPKFPMPNNYEFLLKYHQLFGDQNSLKAVTSTLDNMANGGIYDQIGGGFSRYSTDANWKVPHFEKMLYDNGQLVSLYAQAYKLTKSPVYEQKIRQSLAFVERELLSKENGFYSSLDADSEGEEGKFYIWTKEEIEQIIGDPKTAEIFSNYYNVTSHGNWEKSNILHTTVDKKAFSKKYDMSQIELNNLLSQAGEKLMKARNTRIRPGLDDKILCSWNALMIKGYTDAYQALGDKHYLDIAIKNANFIKKNLLKSDYRLDRNYKNGQSTINAFLDDYALLIHAYIGLYESTFDTQWLDDSALLLDYVHAHFFDNETKMYNYTSDIDPALVARKSELSDNVIPGSNSVLARDLFIVGSYTYDREYTFRAEQMLKNMSEQIVASGTPNFYSNWCQLYLDMVHSPYEIAIIGPDAEQFRKELSAHYLGNSILLGGTSEGNLALLKDKLQEGRTMIYVCQNKTCKFPVDNVEAALKLL